MKRTAVFLVILTLFTAFCTCVGAYDTDYTNSTPPQISKTLTEAVTYEIATDSLIYSKNQNERFPALKSVTHLMIASTVLYSRQQDTSKNKIATEQLEMDLAQMLYNGDEASIANLVMLYADTEDEFISMMNNRAFVLGMKDTAFVNVTGEYDPEQHTSAEDLMLLAKDAYGRDIVKEILSSNEYVITDKTVSFSRSMGILDPESKKYCKYAAFHIADEDPEYGYTEITVGANTAGRAVITVVRESNGTVADYENNSALDVNALMNNAFTAYYVTNLLYVGRSIVQDMHFDLADGSTVYVAVEAVDGAKINVTFPVTYGIIVETNIEDCSIVPITEELPESAELNQILNRAELKYGNDTLLEVDLRVVKIVTADGRQYSADYVLYNIEDGALQAQRQYKKDGWIIAVGLVLVMAVVAVLAAEYIKRKIL